MRVLCATPFLQFSQFNSTCQYGFVAIPIIRCTHTTSSSIMAMTAVPPFLFMLPYLSPLACVAFVCSPYATVHSASFLLLCLFPRFSVSCSYAPETSKCDKAAKYPSEECWIVRSLIYDSVRRYLHMSSALEIQTFGKSRERTRETQTKRLPKNFEI